MVRYFLLGGVDRAELDTRLRLVLHSFLEDGEYARELFDTIFERVHPLFAASIEAAAAAGDLKPGPIASANRFWFGHHIAAMVAFVVSAGPGLGALSRDSLATWSTRRAGSSCAASG